ncbi:uncharacterized protein LOC143076589 [Mytilus galloprovincialis]|uniref:large ribosomal subunit protein mL63-like n=1 Tax=Mytilus edulis TaxID=6550 RepID=UPI0039EEB15F
MQLTRVVFRFFKRYKKVPGLLYGGKNKIIPKIYPQHKERALKWFLMNEENERILSEPYLTEKEEEGHMESLGFTNEARILGEVEKAALERWNKPKDRRIHYLEEHYKHLNIKKSWE